MLVPAIERHRLRDSGMLVLGHRRCGGIERAHWLAFDLGGGWVPQRSRAPGARLSKVVAKLELVLDVVDLDRMVDFYAGALGYQPHGAVGQYRSIVPPTGEPGVKLIFQRVDEPKTVKNRLHLDVHHPDIEAEADRLERLGATRVRRYDEVGTSWIVMSDPEGNEVCVCQG